MLRCLRIVQHSCTSKVESVRRGLKAYANTRIAAGGLPELPGGAKVKILESDHFSIEETGGVLWHDCAAAICRWLTLLPRGSLHGYSVLELGSGTGAVGIFVAAIGAARVTLTDGSEAALLLAKKNVEANRQPQGPVPPSVTISVAHQAWGIPSSNTSGCIDLILASDVIALRKEVPALCDTISELLQLNPHARVVLSHKCRSDYDEQLEYFETHLARRGMKLIVLYSEVIGKPEDYYHYHQEVFILEVAKSSKDSERCVTVKSGMR